MPIVRSWWFSELRASDGGVNVPLQNQDELGLLTICWARRADDSFGTAGFSGIMFVRPRDERDFFKLRGGEFITTSLQGMTRIEHIAACQGTPEFLIKQRVLPVVAWLNGEDAMRCIGTAFLISASGYVITASHVIVDPIEENYGEVTIDGGVVTLGPNLNMGVLIPTSGIQGFLGFQFYQFRQSRYWGNWKESPLFHNRRREFSGVTDIAVAKIDLPPNGAAHQPLNLSLRPFNSGDQCMTIGYSEMQDINFRTIDNGNIVLEQPVCDLYVSIGEVTNVHANNHVSREVPTPGPCFEYHALAPGRMSGSPIFDLTGRVVRGVVSRSFTGERHAYGCMIGPTMELPVNLENATLRTMLATAREGMTHMVGM